MFRKSRRGALTPDHPLRHPDHPLPVTRRQFIAQGLASGAATVIEVVSAATGKGVPVCSLTSS